MIDNNLLCLVDYNYWARDRILSALDALTPEQFIVSMGSSFDSVRDTVAHICDAERIWIARLKGEEPRGKQPLDRLSDVSAARAEWAHLESEMREQLDESRLEDLERTIRYRDLSGKDQAEPLWLILLHVINHGTYHRGQIATLLRKLNATPPQSMDLIVFYRERHKQA